MALGESYEDQDDAVEEKDDSQTGEYEEIDSFLFLRDFLSALDLASMGLKLAHQHLELQDAPEELTAALNIVPDTAQLIALVPDILEKLDNVRVVSEGALQAASANALAAHSAEYLSQQQLDEDDND